MCVRVFMSESWKQIRLTNWRRNRNEHRDKALVMYLFSKDSQIQDLFMTHTSAGSMCCNDTIMQYVGKCFIYYTRNQEK